MSFKVCLRHFSRLQEFMLPWKWLCKLSCLNICIGVVMVRGGWSWPYRGLCVDLMYQKLLLTLQSMISWFFYRSEIVSPKQNTGDWCHMRQDAELAVRFQHRTGSGIINNCEWYLESRLCLYLLTSIFLLLEVIFIGNGRATVILNQFTVQKIKTKEKNIEKRCKFTFSSLLQHINHTNPQVS